MSRNEQKDFRSILIFILGLDSFNRNSYVLVIFFFFSRQQDQVRTHLEYLNYCVNINSFNC